MPNLSDLKNRIASVKSTRKITKAMQMVASAKLRRAQDAAQFGRGDHLHRLCDLAGRFDRRDPVF